MKTIAAFFGGNSILTTLLALVVFLAAKYYEFPELKLIAMVIFAVALVMTIISAFKKADGTDNSE